MTLHLLHITILIRKLFKCLQLWKSGVTFTCFFLIVTYFQVTECPKGVTSASKALLQVENVFTRINIYFYGHEFSNIPDISRSANVRNFPRLMLKSQLKS